MNYPLFDFKFLEVELLPQYKTLKIDFIHPNENVHISTQMVNELEKIIIWLSRHIEVSNVLFSSKSTIFSKGLDSSDLENFSLEELEIYFNQFKKIIHGLFYLPQIIIFDLRKHTEGLAAELSLGADIRIAHQDCSISFNHLDHAIIPSCGACGLLDLFVGPIMAKNWIFSSEPISHENLLHSGFIFQYYLQSHEAQIDILKNLSTKAPIAKIQTKRALLENIRQQVDKTLLNSHKYSLAGLSTMDWKNTRNHDQPPTFTSAIELAKVLSFSKES